eukprot:363499-Chlamydomonas_euryale.AAC.5
MAAERCQSAPALRATAAGGGPAEQKRTRSTRQQAASAAARNLRRAGRRGGAARGARVGPLTSSRSRCVRCRRRGKRMAIQHADDAAGGLRAPAAASVARTPSASAPRVNVAAPPATAPKAPSATPPGCTTNTTTCSRSFSTSRAGGEPSMTACSALEDGTAREDTAGGGERAARGKVRSGLRGFGVAPMGTPCACAMHAKTPRKQVMRTYLVWGRDGGPRGGRETALIGPSEACPWEPT